MSFYAWRPYVSVAARKVQAAAAIDAMKEAGRAVAPVTVEGRTIARSFWGKAWCDNLERYSDYDNRLPRGRTYVRNGSVIDLQIAEGEVTASVMGSSLYTIGIAIDRVDEARWTAICKDSAGAIDSLVELLQGKLAKGVMDRVCREGDGLFPAPGEIRLSCDCPDWADMCKHVAAVLYGVGARLDEQPRLLFTLRGVDENDLVASADGGLAVAKPGQSNRKVLQERDLSALFGLDIAQGAADDEPAPRKVTKKGRKGTASKRKAQAKAKPAKNGRTASVSRRKAEMMDKVATKSKKTAKLAKKSLISKRKSETNGRVPLKKKSAPK